MISNVTEGDLNTMDLGTHMHLLREWNEEEDFEFSPAVMVIQGPFTRIIHEDNHRGLIVATYLTGLEGELVSLLIGTHRDMNFVEYYGTAKG